MGSRPAHSVLRMSYRQGAAYGVASFGSLSIIGLVSSIATARIYGVHVFGQYALTLAPVNAVWFLSSVRERAPFIRQLATLEARAPLVTGLFAAVFAFSFALTAVVAPLVMVGAYFLFNGPIHRPELFAPACVAMAGYLFVTNTGFNIDSVFAGFRAARQLFWIRLYEQLAFIAVALAAGVAWGTVWGLVGATVCSSFSALVHRVLACKPFMRVFVPWSAIREGFSTLPDILRFGIRIAPGAVADGISTETGTWTLGVLGSVSGVGAYNRAWNLGSRFVELSWRINEMLFPTLVERRATGDHHGFGRALLDSIRYSAALMLLPAAAGGGAAHGVMNLLGPGFDRAADALPLIMLVPALACASNFLRHTLYAVEQPFQSTISATGRMLVTVGSCVPLTLWIGVTGTALSVVLGFVADLAYTGGKTRRHLSRPVHHLWPHSEMIALGAAYTLGFVVARLAYGWVGGTVGLILALAGGSATYIAVFVVAGGVNDRDRDRLSTFKRGRFRRKR